MDLDLKSALSGPEACVLPPSLTKKKAALAASPLSLQAGGDPSVGVTWGKSFNLIVTMSQHLSGTYSVLGTSQLT